MEGAMENELRAVRTQQMHCGLERLPASGRLELTAYVSELPAGYDTGRHRHNYSTVAYVLHGVFHFEEGENGETVTDYKAGEMFSERAGVVVSGRALTETRLLVVAPHEPGKPESLAV
jgi:quercetin dioxygenase-like cupin family protein